MSQHSIYLTIIALVTIAAAGTANAPAEINRSPPIEHIG
jgi:hypothetical protein